jgi:hypothetical protein
VTESGRRIGAVSIGTAFYSLDEKAIKTIKSAVFWILTASNKPEERGTCFC